MTDRIEVRGLRIVGRHGVFEFERTRGQEFVVDVSLAFDTGAAAKSDDLADTLDYAGLADRIAAIVSGEPVNLLETLAGRIADSCLADSRVREVTVSVHKPNAPLRHPFVDVVVTITRTGADR